jgi:hypothetical protein
MAVFGEMPMIGMLDVVEDGADEGSGGRKWYGLQTN